MPKRPRGKKSKEMETKRGFTVFGWRLYALATLLMMPACGQPAREMDKMVDIGTHRLHIRCIGSGRPTVVIDTGHGDRASKWYNIQDRLAQDSRVCTYDRAGYGQSEPWPMPRHGERSAHELKMLLEKASVEGPYVLAGASLGGLNVQIFAHHYPDLVAGLVLIDPAPLDFITGAAFPELRAMAAEQASEMLAAAEHTRQSTDPEERAKADYLDAIASELQMMFAETAEQMAAIESFGDTPLTVMAAGRANPVFGEQAEAFQQFWIEQNRALTTKSTNGTFVLVGESGHNLRDEAPDAVVRAIGEMVARVRA